jgi:hypothetical protein
MNTLLICKDALTPQEELVLAKYPNIRVILTVCDGLDESRTVVMTLPEGTVYGHVFPNRLIDVIAKRADDLKLQSAFLYDISMNPYKNEPIYRTNVLQFLPELQQMESFDVPALESLITAYQATHHMSEEQLIHPLKMALVQTTRGPALPAVLAGLGKQESLARIDQYLKQYKYRL